jgi:HK97 family phage major capsid protein
MSYTLPQLKQKKTEYLDAMQDIADRATIENRSFTPAERQRVAELRSEFKKLKQLEESGGYSAGRVSLPEPLGERPSFTPASTRRGGKLYRDLFGTSRFSSDGWSSFEDYLRAVHSGLHHPQLRSAMLTQSIGTPSAGGFIVPEQFVAEMLDKSLESEIVRPRCDVREMKSDTLKVAGFDGRNHTGGSLFGGFTGTWAAELDTATDAGPDYRLIQFDAKKLFIFTRASNELVQDGMSFEAMLGEAMIAALGWHLDYACLRGTGAGQPLGVLNDPALITVSKETGQPASTILYQNLTKMFARLHPACVNNSIWVANSNTIPQLLELTIAVGTGGSVVPVMSQMDGQFTILTRPVLFTEKLPTLGTKGDIMLVDFSQYTLALRKDMSLEKSIHVGWQNDTSGYRSILRADGMGRWGTAVTPRHGDTLSWAVALETRS